MTVASPTDAIFGGCHVVMKYPILAVAFCAIGANVALPEGTPLFNASSFGANQSVECGIDTEYVVPIDLNDSDGYVAVGECLEDFDTLSIAELLQRCEALPANDKLCVQLRNTSE